MTDQDPGHANPSAQASAAAPAKECPKPATTQEATDSAQTAKNPPSTYQKIRESMKDLVVPLLALAVTAITGYYGYQWNKQTSDTKVFTDIFADLTSGDPHKSEPAVNALAMRGKKAFPTLRVVLGTDNVEHQATACEVLRAITIMKPGDQDMRRKILELIQNDIKGGDRLEFRGGAQCASWKDFATEEEGRGLVQAIEGRLGRGAESCNLQKADSEGVIQAVLTESNFPTAGNAPAFLIGVIQNCPDDSDIFLGAKLTALDCLCAVFKKVYPRDWSTEITNKLALLRPSIPVDFQHRIHNKIGDPPCQEEN